MLVQILRLLPDTEDFHLRSSKGRPGFIPHVDQLGLVAQSVREVGEHVDQSGTQAYKTE